MNPDHPLADLTRTWPATVAETGETLRAALDALPLDQWQDDPSLVAAYGAAHRTAGHWQPLAGLPYFDAAEAMIGPDTPPATAAAIRVQHAATLRSLGRFADALAVLDAADAEPLPAASAPLDARIALHGSIALQAGIAYYHLGDYDAAFDRLRRAESLADSRLSRAERVEVAATCAMLCYSRGDFDRSLDFAQRSRDAAEGTTLATTPIGAAGWIAETLIAVEQDRPADARRASVSALAAAADSEWEPLAVYATAAISILTERYVDGLELLRQALQLRRGWPSPGHLVTMTDGLRATLLLRLGETEAAWDLLASLGPTQHHANCPARFIAHLRLASGDAQGTVEALAGCEELGDGHSPRTLVDVLLLRAAAGIAAGSLSQADLAADRAFVLAARNRMRIPFRLVPEPLMAVMTERAGKREQPDAVRDLLQRANGGTVPVAPAEVLSQRERDVVRLIVDGGTVASVADDLYISANTVKTHLKSAYRKLGVDNRADAARRARELGLHVTITRE